MNKTKKISITATQREKEELREHRRFAKKAAKELFYPASVIEKIKQAPDIASINRIMIDARNAS